MKLLTKDLTRKLPALYATENIALGEKTAIAKFFHPSSNWTWYAIEFDGEDICWGLVCGHETEFGYFSLQEISQPAGLLQLPAERDRWFEPTAVQNLKAFGQGGTVY